MALSIKNPETEALARELAERTGESITVAINIALKERMDRKKKSREGLAAWLMALSKETAPLMDDGKTSKEIMDDLYDPETGLPR